MSYTFLSFVGTQHMGVLNPLAGCIHGNIPIDTIHLYASGTSREYAERIQTFCKHKKYPDVHILPWNIRSTNTSDIIDKALEHGEKILFNIDGGLNFAVSKIVIALKDIPSTLVISGKENITLFDTGTQKLTHLPLPPALSVQDILTRQNITWEKSNPSIDICKICREKQILLPKNRIENVQIDGIHFDLVWNDGTNRLSFLTNLYSDNKLNNRLQYTRIRAAKAASKYNQLYDREYYVLCPDRISEEHIAEESRNKAHAIYITRFSLYKKKCKNLADIFQTTHVQQPVKKIQTIQSNTLILVLGDDETATLNAIESHGLNTIVLCHTPDDKMKDKAQRICDLYGQQNKADITPLETDIYGTLLPSQLLLSREASNVHVNITPGTKGHTAFLTWWAVQNHCAVWSINPPHLSRLDAEGKKSIHGCDPLILLQTRRPECQAHDQTGNHPAYKALLQQMKACEKAKKSWELSADFTAGDIRSERINSTTWKIVLRDGTELKLNQESPGEWWEELTAYALRHCQARYVHSRVRVPWRKEKQEELEKKFQETVHRIDMDVIATWKDSHFLISCKAMPNIDEQTVALEAHHMACNISRFAIPMVCTLSDKPAHIINVSDDETKKIFVTVFGWKDLCRPDQMTKLLKQIKKLMRTTKNEKK